jgi:DNA gyrase subunit A
VNFTNPDYYRTKNIPAIGCYLKEDDKEEKQVELGLEI